MSLSLDIELAQDFARIFALVFALVFALILGALPGLGPPASAEERPDDVVILADEMGRSDLGCPGGEIETPQPDAPPGRLAIIEIRRLECPDCDGLAMGDIDGDGLEEAFIPDSGTGKSGFVWIRFTRER